MRRFFRWIRIPVPRHTMPPPGRIEAATAAPKRRVGGVTSMQERIEILSMRLDQAEALNRHQLRHAQKLQERLNRIGKLTPGRQRINELHRVATQFEHEIVRAPERWQADLRADVLFHRRLAHDLGELRDEVRGDKRMPGARNDPTMFRGERP